MSNAGRKAFGIGCLLLVVAVVLALVMIGHRDQSMSPTSSPSAGIEAAAGGRPKHRIHYDVVRQWAIPNGGFGRVIVIAAADSNDSSLRQLGEMLNYETRLDRHASVSVFDDRRAAAMYERATELNKKDGNFYDRHSVAIYDRHIVTGFNQFAILNKKDGTSVVQIKY